MSGQDVLIDVRVVPRASRSEVVGVVNGVWKIRISAPPVDGAANTELVRLLAKRFDVAKSDIEIVRGKTSKNKSVKICNLSESKYNEATR